MSHAARFEFAAHRAFGGFELGEVEGKTAEQRQVSRDHGPCDYGHCPRP